jgi:hypothetical protein
MKVQETYQYHIKSCAFVLKLSLAEVEEARIIEMTCEAWTKEIPGTGSPVIRPLTSIYWHPRMWRPLDTTFNN